MATKKKKKSSATTGTGSKASKSIRAQSGPGLAMRRFLARQEFVKANPSTTIFRASDKKKKKK